MTKSVPVTVPVLSTGIPLQKSISHQIPDGEGSTVLTIFKVPPGRRLVIEDASIQGELPQGQVLGLGILTTVGSDTVINFVGTASAPPGTVIMQTGRAVRFYADPGSDVQIQWWRTGTSGEAGFTAAISGCLTAIT